MVLALLVWLLLGDAALGAQELAASSSILCNELLVGLAVLLMDVVVVGVAVPIVRAIDPDPDPDPDPEPDADPEPGPVVVVVLMWPSSLPTCTSKSNNWAVVEDRKLLVETEVDELTSSGFN